jgi:hypothetical protein
MADREGFVHRWSRRKSEAREQAGGAEPPPSAPAAAEPALPSAAVPAEAGRQDAAAGAIDPATLPDIESLTFQSDFTVFLRPGVPAELRKRALQRLWRSDPVLANLDGLLEYGQDYSKIGTVKEVVRTTYQVGRGLLDRLEAGSAQAPDAPPAGDPSPLEPPARDPGRLEPPARERGDAAGDQQAVIEAGEDEDRLASEAADDRPGAPPRPALKGSRADSR